MGDNAPYKYDFDKLDDAEIIEVYKQIIHEFNEDTENALDFTEEERADELRSWEQEMERRGIKLCRVS